MFYSRFLLLFICLTGCATRTADNVPSPVHIVRAGETLGTISKKFNTTVAQLTKDNNLSNPDILVAGQRLVVRPGAGDPIRASFGVRHLTKERTLDISHVSSHVGKLCTPLKDNRVISRFGNRALSFHEGIDIKAEEGTIIHAVTGGIVILSGVKNGYGKIVAIQEGALLTVYAHNSRNLVSNGDIIKAGQPIAKVGETGNAKGPHLHFEVRVERGDGQFVAVNPLSFYPDGKGACA